MFVGIARVTLSIPGAASLKDKRSVLRKLLDRTRAKFNVAAAEVGDQDLWQKATVGFAVVGNEQRFVTQCLDTLLHFVEELYLAPVIDRHSEVLSFNGDMFGSLGIGHTGTLIDSGNRTLAEAEGLVDPDDQDDWTSGSDGLEDD
jgi:uncharacterized protein YlxP (DUF503 family)